MSSFFCQFLLSMLFVRMLFRLQQRVACIIVDHDKNFKPICLNNLINLSCTKWKSKFINILIDKSNAFQNVVILKKKTS